MSTSYVDLNARIINDDGSLSENTVDICDNPTINLELQKLETDQLNITSNKQQNTLHSYVLNVDGLVTLDGRDGSVSCQKILNIPSNTNTINFDQVKTPGMIAGLASFVFKWKYVDHRPDMRPYGYSPDYEQIEKYYAFSSLSISLSSDSYYYSADPPDNPRIRTTEKPITLQISYVLNSNVVSAKRVVCLFLKNDCFYSAYGTVNSAHEGTITMSIPAHYGSWTQNDKANIILLQVE